MGRMNAFLDDVVREGAVLCQRSDDFESALAAYIQRLREHRWWSEKELRDIEIAISLAVKPLKTPERWNPSNS
jgi:hypothetical protein